MKQKALLLTIAAMSIVFASCNKEQTSISPEGAMGKYGNYDIPYYSNLHLLMPNSPISIEQ